MQFNFYAWVETYRLSNWTTVGTLVFVKHKYIYAAFFLNERNYLQIPYLHDTEKLPQDLHWITEDQIEDLVEPHSLKSIKLDVLNNYDYDLIHLDTGKKMKDILPKEYFRDLEKLNQIKKEKKAKDLRIIMALEG